MTKKPGTVCNEVTETSQNSLHYLAFENALHASIIFLVGSGKILASNIAASILLGYTKEELHTKNRADVFNKNESSFKKMLKQRTADGQATAVVTATKKNGKIIPCEITSAIFTENGKENAITTIVDLSETLRRKKRNDKRKAKIVSEKAIIAQNKSDVRLAENNEWIKCIAKTSYDVMWDWDLSTGEIYVGDSSAEVFGYKVHNNLIRFPFLLRCLATHEKGEVERRLYKTLASDSKRWKDTFDFKRKDGTIAVTTSRASIIRDEDNKAVRLIGAIHDISRLQDLEIKLKEQSDFRVNAKPTLNVLWEWNLVTNKVSMEEGFDGLVGLLPGRVDADVTDWRNFIHAEDKVAIEKGLQDAVKTLDTQWQHAHRFTKIDGSSANVFNKASIFRGPDNKAFRMIGVIHDIGSVSDPISTPIHMIHGKKSKLTATIKKIILELIHHSTERLQVNFSDYLSTKLQYDYTYLANLFSEEEGISIQQFFLVQKIERAKELILLNELSLTAIAQTLQYSSVAHLSNKFKKVTGLSPTRYKQRYQKQSQVHNV